MYEIVNKWNGRFFAVFDPHGKMVCITVYRCGAEEVIRRLAGPAAVPKRRRCYYEDHHDHVYGLPARPPAPFLGAGI